jgi:hypothetical protein
VTEDSRNLELLVHRIQQQLSPTAEVLHNVYLPGRISKVDRQIDVLVRQKIGQYEMLIVLDCKDHARPIDVTGDHHQRALLFALVDNRDNFLARAYRRLGWQRAIEFDLHRRVHTLGPTIPSAGSARQLPGLPNTTAIVGSATRLFS